MQLPLNISRHKASQTHMPMKDFFHFVTKQIAKHIVLLKNENFIRKKKKTSTVAKVLLSSWWLLWRLIMLNQH